MTFKIRASERITIALTGASGVQYGLRLTQCLIQANVSINLLFSKAALVVLQMEMGINLSNKPELQKERLCDILNLDKNHADNLINIYSDQDWGAPIASGSNISRAMVICPCTTGTLASIAHGMSDNLIERAADVSLKERKDLILVVRETPFSQIHLENMLKLTQAGALIMPANPGFYHKPQTVADIVDFMVARILDQLKIPQTLMDKWGD
ncbi:3-octaprenyl-4-hydroxybenzoate carboxy-lyase [Gammaproteobacteria bacterium]|nr:3-octaprenyl-4-hydroxybenzoate carboxy-lyase [Gammaproteobacteria bacterium]